MKKRQESGESDDVQKRLGAKIGKRLSLCKSCQWVSLIPLSIHRPSPSSAPERSAHRHLHPSIDHPLSISARVSFSHSWQQLAMGCWHTATVTALERKEFVRFLRVWWGKSPLPSPRTPSPHPCHRSPCQTSCACPRVWKCSHRSIFQLTTKLNFNFNFKRQKID